MAERKLFGEHVCVLTTNKGLAKLAAEIINEAHDINQVAVVAAQDSWAVQKLPTNLNVYAIVDWRTLQLMGWEYVGFKGSRLSGPWLGAVDEWQA